MRVIHKNLLYGVVAIITLVAVVTPSSDPVTFVIYSLPVVAVYLAGAFTPRRRAN